MDGWIGGIALDWTVLGDLKRIDLLTNGIAVALDPAIVKWGSEFYPSFCVSTPTYRGEGHPIRNLNRRERPPQSDQARRKHEGQKAESLEGCSGVQRRSAAYIRWHGTENE